MAWRMGSVWCAKVVEEKKGKSEELRNTLLIGGLGGKSYRFGSKGWEEHLRGMLEGEGGRKEKSRTPTSRRRVASALVV